MNARIQQAIALSFAGLIVFGTVLLMIPISSTQGGLTALEALFMSTSAVCVTGLAVVDPGTALTPFGQGVLALLVQLGGLGIISLSAFVTLALSGGREGLATRLYVGTAHGSVAHLSAWAILRGVVLVTMVVELIAAAALFVGFGLHFGRFDDEVLWSAVFHAVSAFCNAGFSLYPANLEPFRDDWVVNLTVMGAIVSGGIGFAVLAELLEWRARPREQRRWWRLSLHTRIVLTATLALILGGAVLFWIFESQRSLREVPWHGQLLASLFYSVTCRTAGFNTVTTGALTTPTLLAGILLMYIGASPGGTGGGVKTSTAAILYYGALSRLRGRPDIEIMGRAIPIATVSKAIATAASFAFLIGLAVIGMQLTDGGLAPHDRAPSPLLDHLFEIVSAIGTVGLSTGITAKLSDGGQLILIALMYLGRIGPLLLGASLIGERAPARRSLPEEDVIVG